MTRIERYEKMMNVMERLENEGRILTLRPTLPPISKFEKDSEKIMDSYRDGYNQASQRIDELMEFMGAVRAQAV